MGRGRGASGSIQLEESHMVPSAEKRRKTCSRALSQVARFPPLQEQRCCFRLAVLPLLSRCHRPRSNSPLPRGVSNTSGGTAGDAGIRTAGVGAIVPGIHGAGAGIALSTGSTAAPSAIAGEGRGAACTALGSRRTDVPTSSLILNGRPRTGGAFRSSGRA